MLKLGFGVPTLRLGTKDRTKKAHKFLKKVNSLYPYLILGYPNLLFPYTWGKTKTMNKSVCQVYVNNKYKSGNNSSKKTRDVADPRQSRNELPSGYSIPGHVRSGAKQIFIKTCKEYIKWHKTCPAGRTNSTVMDYCQWPPLFPIGIGNYHMRPDTTLDAGWRRAERAFSKNGFCNRIFRGG